MEKDNQGFHNQKTFSLYSLASLMSSQTQKKEQLFSVLMQN